MAKVPLRNYNREIETMIDRGQLDEAIAHCQHILKTFPKHLETYRLLGKAYLEYKRREEAADIFLRVLAAEPNDFVANVGMSILRDEENKLDDAIWHMERAFEVQPSNPAIQGELQRLYGRRDGVQPPRIRMTRGALAHMYVQGELYPQAISEIKSVLKEDHGRSDMQVLLARAYYKSGQKNDAAEAANSVLRRYPYCFDANRVLTEILGAERPENAQVYRQRVVELDPYAAQVTGTIFQSNEVSDNAVSLEALDWNGQPVKMGSDWGETRAIAPESGRGTQEEPDWLKSGFEQSTPPPAAKPTVVPPVQAPSPSFDLSASSEPAALPTPEEDIPEFLRAAGWDKSTGAFDESKSSFAEELEAASVSDAPIEQAELPDWVKEMMPQEAAQPPAASAQPAEEEELPDWIKNIGPGAVAATAVASGAETTDWLQGSNESERPAEETPDWMKGFEQPAEATSALPADDSLDWLKGLDQPAVEATPPAAESQPDWMQGIEQPAEATSTLPADDSLDWLKGLDQPAAEATPPAAERQPDWTQTSEPSAASDDSLDWLKSLDQPASEEPVASESQLDWLGSVEPTPPAQLTPADEQPDWMMGIEPPVESASTPSADDSLDWLKGFDQPAAEEPIASDSQPDWLTSVGSSETTQPAPAEEQPGWMRSFGEPAQQAQPEPANEFDWLDEVGAESQPASAMEQPLESAQLAAAKSDFDFFEELAEKPTEPRLPPVPPVPSLDTGKLGTSQQEIDDSLAWLENLAAKQGATEGLLTKPEERLQDEPEWVKQAKGLATESAAPEPVQEKTDQPTPASKVEELGKSQQEIDASLAWLENLAAKQGATEGLLTKPEERLQEEPEWVKQAKSAPAPQEPVAQTPSEPAPTGNVDELGKSQQEIDDSLAWLENLAAKQGATEGLLTKPEERLQEEPEWVKQAKSAPASQEPVASSQPAPEEIEDSGPDTEAWIRSLDQQVTEPEPAKDETALWFERLEEPAESAPVSESVPSDEMPDWLRNLEVEESKPAVPASADATAMWLKDLDKVDEPAPVIEELPAEAVLDWLKESEIERAPVAESNVPEAEVGGDFAWLDEVESESATVPATSDESLPSWLMGVDEDTRLPETGSLSELPGWMRDETGEALAEPTKIEPTRPSDWQPEDEPRREPPVIQPVAPEPSKPEPVAAEPAEEQPKPKPAPRKTKAEPRPEPYREPETIRGAGMLTMPVDPILGSARNELSRSNIPGALEAYGKLIKKGRYLDEVIYDLREALDRFPVEVSILQSLGDAYMRANRLQDALDAYTKAEELLR